MEFPFFMVFIIVSSHLPNLSESYLEEIKHYYSIFLTDVLCGLFLLVSYILGFMN